MIFKEEKRDLFSVEDKYYFAHCISADYQLGAGIAVEFEKRFKLKRVLNEVGDHKYPKCRRIDNVFNLVTKEKYWHKPTYEDLITSLEIMKLSIQLTNKYDKAYPPITHIAMPRIGCGLDKLEWSKVREIIKDIFKDMDIEILVCYL
jgi:hypothetical protein